MSGADRSGRSQPPDDLFFDENLADLEGAELKRHLEQKGYRAAEIQIDFERQGAMFTYARARRLEAAEALQMLVEADPRDSVRIAQMQAQVKEYLRIVVHIRGVEEEAAAAAEQIREQFDDEHDEH